MTSTSAERESASARRPRDWWDHPAFVLGAVLACALPLLWPNIPPLVDLPGHMGRYHVQMRMDEVPVLREFYDFQWALIGNLGVDLLVVPLSALIGLEPAVKLITILIPLFTASGFLWVAREVHGRIPPTAYFALPIVYCYPLNFGFVNFAFSMGLAFLAFALWLRLARLGHLKLRAGLFVPISILVWICHAFGWGTLGVMAFSAELVRQVDLKRGFFKGAFKTGLHCLALVPPVLLMLLWRSGEHVGGETGSWFRWKLKLDWVLMILRDRWYWWDEASLALLGLLLLMPLLLWRRLEYSRNLAASAIFLAIVFVCLPRIVFGSNYADMRLAPFVLAVAVLAIRYRPAWTGRAGGAFAVIGLSFFAARIAGNTLSFWQYDRAYDHELAAVAHIPREARLVSFVGVPCRRQWSMSRLEHLPALALVRRDAFSNDQWSMSGAQLLTARYPSPDHWFSRDPSQQVLARHCRGERWLTLDESLAMFPRDKFDHVWLINPPPYDPALTSGLQEVWRSGRSVLYRVADRRPLAPAQEEAQ
ncbi:MAG TPA: hypothetical protein VIA98_03710 [Allosphingosinicella sp.]|jgi:hypothetical protein